MAAKTAVEKKTESQTSPSDDAQSSEPKAVTIDGSEKVAAGQSVVRAPGMSSILGGPTADSLNPAFAPLSEDEDKNGVKNLGLEPQKPADEDKSGK